MTNKTTSPAETQDNNQSKEPNIVKEFYNYTVIKKEDSSYYHSKELKVRKIVRKLK